MHCYCICDQHRCHVEERDRLITDYLYLVREVAADLWRTLPSFVELDDLISAGNEGLIAAASTFDPAVGVKFCRFAKTRIHGAMIDHLRRADPIKRTTRRWQKRIRRIEGSLGRAVTDEELAGEFDCTVARARKIRALASVRLWSLDKPKRAGENDANHVPCPRPSPFDDLVAGELADIVKRAIALLPRRHAHVLEMYYRHGFSNRQIAEHMALSQGRVSQIRASALDKLEVLLHGFGLHAWTVFPKGTATVG